MKNILDSIKLTQIIPKTLALAAITMLAHPTEGRGTDILHFSTRTGMTNEGIPTEASGRVNGNLKSQGNAHHQNLDITARGLDKNHNYKIFVLIGNDHDLTQVGEFTSDAHGRGLVRFRDQGDGRKILPLFGVLDPVTDIRSLSIFNSNRQAVLTADLASPDKLQYLVKRDLSTPSVGATLRIQSNGNKTQFKLTAAGLSPTTDYRLFLNGGVVQTNATDANGRLRIDSLLETPSDILDLRSLSLRDSVNNVLIRTTLP